MGRGCLRSGRDNDNDSGGLKGKWREVIHGDFSDKAGTVEVLPFGVHEAQGTVSLGIVGTRHGVSQLIVAVLFLVQ